MKLQKLLAEYKEWFQINPNWCDDHYKNVLKFFRNQQPSRTAIHDHLDFIGFWYNQNAAMLLRDGESTCWDYFGKAIPFINSAL